MRAIYLLSLLTTQLAWASPFPADTYFPPSEKLVFTMKFIDTTAGECEFETLAPTTWSGRPAYHFRATVRTIGLIGFIYPYTETVDLYFDREKQVPLFVDININDRKKIQHTQIRLDSQARRGEEIEDSKDVDGSQNHRRKNWQISPGAQSLFSILHYLRVQNLSLGGRVSFPVAHDERNATFAAEVLRTEKIRVAKADHEALVLGVLPVFTDTFYPNLKEMPLLWISNDSQKRLLKFELKHKRGKVYGVLKASS